MVSISSFLLPTIPRSLSGISLDVLYIHLTTPDSDVQDLLYIADITIGGVPFAVQLDTGSSDLWVLPTSSPLPDAKLSSVSLNLTYGIGAAQGTIAFAPVEFAGISVSNQSYLNASSAQNPALSYGAAGILGLGFDSLSDIDFVLNSTSSSAGRTLLHNLFLDNPSEPNFIAFSLQSTSDGDGVQGTLSVGEIDPQYANVTNMNKIPTWPVTAPNRWNVLLDSFTVGLQVFSVSSTVTAAPANKAVVLFDSGTSYTYAPVGVCTAIYGGVSGAQYDSKLGKWRVPCDAEIDVALQISNQIFPIHPLDVTPTTLGDPNSCIGSFIPQNVSVGSGQFDWLLGDNVLRSIYALYDYGDFGPSGMAGNPYVRLLSLVDPLQASVEFHNVRGGTPNTNITYNVSNSTSTPTSTAVALSSDDVAALENLSKFLPAIFAVMGLNAVVLIALVIGGIIFLCKRRGKNIRARKTPGRLNAMPAGNPSASRLSESSGQVPHTYQPVSMALTEDTLFVPPTPGFKTEFSAFGRPNSTA